MMSNKMIKPKIGQRVEIHDDLSGEILHGFYVGMQKNEIGKNEVLVNVDGLMSHRNPVSCHRKLLRYPLIPKENRASKEDNNDSCKIVFIPSMNVFTSNTNKHRAMLSMKHTLSKWKISFHKIKQIFDLADDIEIVTNIPRWEAQEIVQSLEKHSICVKIV